MNGEELLRVVDAIHRDKGIETELVFDGIEQALTSAARKHFGEESEIVVSIDRLSGQPAVAHNGEDLDSNEIGDLLGRIAAQTAKQVMIQKIREAERDALFLEFEDMQSQILNGTVTRVESGALTISLGKIEGFLPRSEQIPRESHRTGDRIRAVVMDVRKVGSRVRIVLSRTHPDFIRRLFESEIPEIGSDRVIEVKSIAREAGFRSKVAVSCFDSKVDSIGACVGVRGARIKSIVDELSGERIDIVRWNDSLQVLVPNALQPAEVEDVILCPMLGKVIVLVRDEQLSLAIGKKGQNVRLASKLVGWDIHVMTQEKLDVQLEISVADFCKVPGISEDLAENLVAQGFFSFDDLSIIEPDQLAELGGLTDEQCDVIVEYADREAEIIEKEEIEAKKRMREQAAKPPVVEEAKVEEAVEPDTETVAEAATETEAESETEVEDSAGEEPQDETGSDGGETEAESEEEA
jgi:transcription termination/antitermination protein NusA